MKQFRQKLKKLREENALTQPELAQILHVYTITLKPWESGRSPRTKYIIEVSKFFKVTMDYLMIDSDHMVHYPAALLRRV